MGAGAAGGDFLAPEDRARANGSCLVLDDHVQGVGIGGAQLLSAGVMQLKLG